MIRAKGPTYRVPFRRRREGKTDYRRRLKLLLSRKNRVVVRKSNKTIKIQLISADTGGDKTLVSALSSELPKYGYTAGTCNGPAAYLTGLLFGKRALESGFDDGIFDIGLVTPVHGSNVYATLKGALDSGMEIPHDPAVFPAEERIAGKPVASFLQQPDIVDMIHAVKETIMSDSGKGTEEDAAAE
jgi:large subunit ribosomal protein L18